MKSVWNKPRMEPELQDIPGVAETQMAPAVWVPDASRTHHHVNLCPLSFSDHCYVVFTGE